MDKNSVSWVKWAGEVETNDLGYTIYRDYRHAILRYPDGKMEKFRMWAVLY